MMPATPGTRIATYGNAPSTSTGTAVTAGGANAEGTWTQLDAATANAIRWLAVNLGAGPANTTARGLLDIGFGASGAECQAIANFPFETNTTSDAIAPSAFGAVPCSIPKGARLVARVQSTTASLATVVAAYGVD